MTTSRPLHPPDDPLWTLEELRAHAGSLLEAEEITSGNGRVRVIPDERTLRYYTTIGLLSGPAVLKGRKAFYSMHHLAQIVAIKRLQSLGMSLAQIQQELTGATSREIESMAKLPKKLPEPLPVASYEMPAPKRTFWQEQVAAPKQASDQLRSGMWFELAPGLVILLESSHSPSGQGLKALVDASSSLRYELLRQGLIPTKQPSGENHG